LIDEYYEPDPSSRRHYGDIPIRGRSEFLPGVAMGTSTVMSRPNATEDYSQLNLALGHSEGEKRKPEASRSPRPASEPRLIRATDAPGGVSESDASGESAIRFGKQRDPTYDLFNLKHFDARRRKRVTLGGFLTGCALGTAGAGLLLLGLRIFIG